MRFFDYIFYRVSNYYTRRWHDNEGYFYGITVVLAMLVLHTMFLLLLVAIIWEPANSYLFLEGGGIRFPFLLRTVPVLTLAALIALRYLKFRRYEVLDRIWREENLRMRKRRALRLLLTQLRISPLLRSWQFFGSTICRKVVVASRSVQCPTRRETISTGWVRGWRRRITTADRDGENWAA